jgi:hypothetical protein
MIQGFPEFACGRDPGGEIRHQPCAARGRAAGAVRERGTCQLSLIHADFQFPGEAMEHRSLCCHSNSRIACVHDERVRLVRSDLLIGIIFSGEVDTAIVFDYGIFTAGCRRATLRTCDACREH